MTCRTGVVVISAILLGGCGVSEETPEAIEMPAVEVEWNRSPLQQAKFMTLPLGAVKPRGWLKKQLRIQADGLTGHLPEFWEDLGPNSGWLGGDGESWERGPYYLDGFVPLAHLLEDEPMVEQANRWVEWTLANQRESGAIGPDRNTGKFARDWQKEDWWPNMVMLKVLKQHHEATGDERVIPLVHKYLLYHLEHAEEAPLVAWAKMRWAEEILSIVWIYNQTGDEKLLELARIIESQAYRWREQFASFPDEYKVKHGPLTKELRENWGHLRTHVVNNAMALKTAAVWWQISGNDADKQAIHEQLEVLDRYHGTPVGAHSGDEHYAGLDPTQGFELCSVVEAMFSYETLLSVLGDPAFGDRLEQVAYNALPATFKPDMWAHQYDQQVNQVLCSVDENRNWTTNGPDSNTFGLEPNFGCCTANMHQGWPKFVTHMWMATHERGLAAMAYGPNQVTARVGQSGRQVTIDVETGYPFNEEILMRVTPEREASDFPLALRIPAWAGDAAVFVNGESQDGVKAGTFFSVHRTWSAGDTVQLKLPMRIRAGRGYRDSVFVRRGPLVYSLEMGEDWRKIKGEEPHADWAVHPTTPWNYALRMDVANPEASVTLAFESPPDTPFDPARTPIKLEATGRRLPGWKLFNSSAGPLPQSPVTSSAADETLTLIPYGSTNLRVTAFPLLGE